MTAADTDLEVARIIREVSGFGGVTPVDRLIEDLALDSLEIVELRVGLELRFHIEIEDEFGTCRTVGDVLRLVEKAMKRREP